jgi:hypothetical protein
MFRILPLNDADVPGDAVREKRQTFLNQFEDLEDSDFFESLMT